MVIAERIFGMLLVAVAVQLLLFGLSQVGLIEEALLH